MTTRVAPCAVAGRVIALVVCASLSFTMAGTPIARATDEPTLDRPVRRHGECTDRSTWTIKARPAQALGVWRLRLEVETGRPDHRWNIFLYRNGARFFSGSRRSDHAGMVLARMRGEDGPGGDQDRFRFGALNVATGETCRGALRA